MNEPIHIVSGADARFSPGLLVVATSALANLPNSTAVFFHVLDGGLPSSVRKELKFICKTLQPKGEVVFHNIQNTFLKQFSAGLGGSAMFYARLQMASLIPEAEKVIYLDADMVVLGNLLDLWSRDLDLKTAWACQDHKLNHLEEDCPWTLDANERSYPYFNSGMMIVDLRAWRRDNLEEILISEARKAGKKLQWWDQTVLNYVLRGKVGILPKAWNWQQSNFPTGDDTVKVIHFTSPKKPWLYWGLSRRHEIWRNFFKKSGGRYWHLIKQYMGLKGFAEGIVDGLLLRFKIFRKAYIANLEIRRHFTKNTDRKKDLIQSIAFYKSTIDG